jgi:HTH-type transcriptional regulator/antitoxin MqsA
VKSLPPICPVCEQGALSPQVYSDDFQHAGKSLRVDGLERYLCDVCGADPILTDQIRRNQVRVCDAKRQTDGYLTSDEIRELRERLQLSQPEAAILFGGGPNAFSKYERGEVIQSLAMDRLLRCTLAFPCMVGYLRALAGLDPQTTETGAYKEIQDLSLADPGYTSKPVLGKQISASPSKRESSVVSIPEWQPKKVA